MLIKDQSRLNSKPSSCRVKPKVTSVAWNDTRRQSRQERLLQQKQYEPLAGSARSSQPETWRISFREKMRKLRNRWTEVWTNRWTNIVPALLTNTLLLPTRERLNNINQCIGIDSEPLIFTFMLNSSCILPVFFVVTLYEVQNLDLQSSRGSSAPSSVLSP